MNCKEAKTRWHARYDAGRTAYDTGTDHNLEAHIASCEACREYDTEMKLIVGALDQIGAEPIPENVATAPLRTAPHDYGKLLRIAAVIALVAGGALWFATSMPRSNTREEIQTEIAEGPTNAPTGEELPQQDRRIGLSLRGESANNFLAMRQPTSVPNVQMYWLYPTLRAEEDETEPRP